MDDLQRWVGRPREALVEMAKRAHRHGLVLSPTEQAVTGLGNAYAKPGTGYYEPGHFGAQGGQPTG